MAGGFQIKLNGGRGIGAAPAPSAPAAGAASDGEPGKIRIGSEDLVEDRYHRLRLIGWWDQKRLHEAVVIVAGAGALGNEAIKNLALLGVGRMIVSDTDTIETSNLTRSVLFRLHDVGRHKAVVAAERAMEMNPDVKAIPVEGDLRFALGLGLFRRADVVLGCLDNIAARVYLSRQAYRMGKPSVDAGLDHLNGDVYTFAPPTAPATSAASRRPTAPSSSAASRQAHAQGRRRRQGPDRADDRRDRLGPPDPDRRPPDPRPARALGPAAGS